MKTTYNKLIQFNNTANNYLRAADEAKQNDTPLVTALEECLEDCKPQIDQYNKKLSRLRRRFAEKDKRTTVLLKDEHGNYQFTEEAENNLEDEIEKLLDEEVRINPTYVSELPEDLHRRFVKIFTGFVIEPKSTPARELIKSLPTTKQTKTNGK
ncbi:hypothetical protein [Dyadobacter fermentans]|uniref:Uncharacterized protein n=1 Tax=Dyadobacter fermentans (strain ATCC 700827 / DSM 18053 / CIP 107007 / KCTC 52180 / NS114) TaxID=471854 RepID=C6VVI2_DYAFD|nr:hypothetical protein [Dyadobacter fermentans]ACT96712.1 hypothetical protein Dfer_5521 [Dyadobacter fermentans DSM 18053]